MKNIDRIDWTKVTEPIMAITLTNLGSRANPKFQVHYLKNKQIIDKGVFDAQRVVEVADKVGYNIGNYFQWKDITNDDIVAILRTKMASSFVGLMMKLTGIKAKRINTLL